MVLLIATLEKYCILGFEDCIGKETTGVVEQTKVEPECFGVFGEWMKLPVPSGQYTGLSSMVRIVHGHYPK
jgi:hypothetical protein